MGRAILVLIVLFIMRLMVHFITLELKILMLLLLLQCHLLRHLLLRLSTEWLPRRGPSVLLVPLLLLLFAGLLLVQEGALRLVGCRGQDGVLGSFASMDDIGC